MNKTIKQVLDDMLARREYSQFEATSKLRQKGFVAESIDNIIAHYVELGYISDARYVEQKVRSLMLRGYGPGYVRQVLKQGRLSFCADHYDWQDAYQVAQRKAGNKTGLKRRDYLYRRGFIQGQYDGA